MSNKTEKRITAKNSAATPLPDDLAALFAETRQASPKELAALAKAANVLHADPAFQADISKGLIVEDILRAMEEQGLNRNTLAAKLGKSRQYIGKILDEEQPANFTIDTLAELSAALGIKLHVRILPENERMIFVRGLTVTTKVEPTIDFPKSETKHAAIFDDRFEASNITPFTSKAHAPARLSS
jgi:ribosome-binding protein aMBF1 (putative translation factor)